MASSMLQMQAHSLSPIHSLHHSQFVLISSAGTLLPPRLIDSASPLLTASIKRSRNTAAVRPIRAQNVPDYVPDANFYKVEAVLRPWRIPQVSSALLNIGIRGVTVSDVRGFGAQGGLTERQAGSEFTEDKFLHKVKMEVVVSKDQVEAVIDKIIEVARTGEIGDGKIFLIPVADVIRVRTGERGEMAERMKGGRADMTLSTGVDAQN
ncbi:nitrogen regulatory protein P-II homolog [Impatiens glandulifera]|uniref:nitrogen regulatory protein P-II homolog n=1 Tax=Impatiens glandulifera TaxID=253017 RepID=UPI001FB131D7|nr:nitrogen regulatory protein P-II homolog [Impatiens glandulifera]